MPALSIRSSAGCEQRAARGGVIEAKRGGVYRVRRAGTDVVYDDTAPTHPA